MFVQLRIRKTCKVLGTLTLIFCLSLAMQRTPTCPNCCKSYGFKGMKLLIDLKPILCMQTRCHALHCTRSMNRWTFSWDQLCLWKRRLIRTSFNCFHNKLIAVVLALTDECSSISSRPTCIGSNYTIVLCTMVSHMKPSAPRVQSEW